MIQRTEYVYIVHFRGDMIELIVSKVTVSLHYVGVKSFFHGLKVSLEGKIKKKLQSASF